MPLCSKIAKPLIFLGLAALGLPISCGPSHTNPPPQRTAGSPTSGQTILERGYSLHQAKCAKCHAFEDPADYEVAELTHEIMPSMAKKSKLNHDDEAAVLAYLLSARNPTTSR
jgi:mono/diheme cytochrome c family protein